ncbi:hypothetical protein GQ457_06G016900 [Hibiscus cannabinus]
MEAKCLELVCNCGARSTLTTGRTDENPGRRFWGCENYEKSLRACKIFVWYDPPVQNQSRSVIVGLLRKVSAMERAKKEMFLGLCFLFRVYSRFRINKSVVLISGFLWYDPQVLCVFKGC